MRRFFMPDIPETQLFSLPEEESKHIVRVLRMTEGDDLLLLNGLGLLVHAKISAAHPKKCQITVVERTQKERDQASFHLAIAPTKNLDRMEWMVEKIVEIGATKLTFIQCERSERVNLKLERLERVAISAMKQAEQDFLLEIEALTPFKQFVETYPGGGIAHCMEGAKKAVGELKNPTRILIGPEGDFSQQEVDFALKHDYETIHLGTSRLRTETAGMVATVLAITARV